MSSPDENKVIYRRLIDEVWNGGNLDVVDELLCSDATAPSAPDLPPGPEGLKAVVRVFRTAFPDFRIAVKDLVAEGDKVAARLVETGTHHGVFLGIAPTGRRVRFTEMAIVRVRAGKIVESWWEADMLRLYQQVDLVTPFGDSSARPAEPRPTVAQVPNR